MSKGCRDAAAERKKKTQERDALAVRVSRGQRREEGVHRRFPTGTQNQITAGSITSRQQK